MDGLQFPKKREKNHALHTAFFFLCIISITTKNTAVKKHKTPKMMYAKAILSFFGPSDDIVVIVKLFPPSKYSVL